MWDWVGGSGGWSETALIATPGGGVGLAAHTAWPIGSDSARMVARGQAEQQAGGLGWVVSCAGLLVG